MYNGHFLSDHSLLDLLFFLPTSGEISDAMFVLPDGLADTLIATIQESRAAQAALAALPPAPASPPASPSPSPHQAAQAEAQAEAKAKAEAELHAKAHAEAQAQAALKVSEADKKMHEMQAQMQAQLDELKMQADASAAAEASAKANLAAAKEAREAEREELATEAAELRLQLDQQVNDVQRLERALSSEGGSVDAAAHAAHAAHPAHAAHAAQHAVGLSFVHASAKANLALTEFARTYDSPQGLLNEPGHWDFFVSHTQRSGRATTLATKLFGSLNDVWLDVEMSDKSEAAMKEGVYGSKVVLAIITDEGVEGSAYFGKLGPFSSQARTASATTSCTPAAQLNSSLSTA